MPESPTTLATAAAAIRAGDTTSRALVQEALTVAERDDPTLGVFLARFDETALAAADRADTDVAAGRPLGPLHGVPIGVKDLLATREAPITAQSLVVDPGWGAEDAAVISQLRDTGAVIIGKTSMMELAYGTHDPAHPFPIPGNPWRPEAWPGGSSSGSAAGIAAGMMLGSVGTDTGGSIRVPAAMCGITGIKPTHGLVPVEGCLPLSWTQDHVGPLAATAEDCRILLRAMTGRSMPAPSGHDLTGVRIGVDRLERITQGGQDPSVAPLLDDALAVLVERGARLVDVELPLYREVTDAGFLSVSAERMAYHRENLPHGWHDYGRNARLGMARAAHYSAADYVQAQRVRELGRRKVAELFADVDVIAGPMCSATTPLRTELDSFMGGWKQLVHAPYWDALGHPAMSVPMGFDTAGMPMGMQLIGPPFGDPALLHVAEAFQARTNWHRRRPEPTVAKGSD